MMEIVMCVARIGPVVTTCLVPDVRIWYQLRQEQLLEKALYIVAYLKHNRFCEICAI